MLTGSMLCMQTFTVNIPVFLATPASIAIVMAHCTKGISFLDQFTCYCLEGLESFHTDDKDKWDITGLDTLIHIVVLFAAWIALHIICGHIWFPRQDVLDTSEK